MEQESEAIAIWRRRFSESSLIVTWFTASHGKIKTSARGALRPKSPLAGRIDLFHETRIGWTPARKGDVHYLREAEVRLPFTPTSAHTALLCASYFAALVDATSQPGDPHADVYDLLVRALRYLRKKIPTRTGVYHFEKELAKALGIWDPGQPHGAFPALENYAGQLPPSRRSLLDSLN